MHGLQHGQLLPCQSSISTSKAFLPFRRSYSRRKRPRAVSAEQHTEPPENTGNPNVQQKLMDIIRVQIGQEKVKDFVKVEREKLRQAAEEVQMGRLFVILSQLLLCSLCCRCTTWLLDHNLRLPVVLRPRGRWMN